MAIFASSMYTLVFHILSVPKAVSPTFQFSLLVTPEYLDHSILVKLSDQPVPFSVKTEALSQTPILSLKADETLRSRKMKDIKTALSI